MSTKQRTIVSQWSYKSRKRDADGFAGRAACRAGRREALPLLPHQRGAELRTGVVEDERVAMGDGVDVAVEALHGVGVADAVTAADLVEAVDGIQAELREEAAVAMVTRDLEVGRFLLAAALLDDLVRVVEHEETGRV